MIDNSCSCVSKSCACIVSKRHDTNILDILRKKVLEPEGVCLAVGPSLLCISIKSMDSYKARLKMSVRTYGDTMVMERGEHSWNCGTYSTWICL
jgi:hypothetical protein